MREYEVKVLDIDPDILQKKLKVLGAKQVYAGLMRRWVYDFVPGKKDWIRLRDNGENVTLTYKRRNSYALGDTEEVELVVSDVATTDKVLRRLGFALAFYQENKRILYILDGVEFALDWWPRLPPYLEVEATNEEGVRKGLALLGLEGKEVGNLSIRKVYAKQGIELHRYPRMVFADSP